MTPKPFRLTTVFFHLEGTLAALHGRRLKAAVKGPAVRRLMKRYLLTVCLTICFLVTCLATIGCAETVKEPSVAGSFYPADRKELKETVDSVLAKSKIITKEGSILALISPHAGYTYSGQVAAYGYRQIQDRDIRKIILIGQSHRSEFKGASVYTSGAFRTPLGIVKIDEKSAKKLLNESADIKFYPEAFAKEHSIEVQLPFLQTVLKDFTVIPILTGSPTRQTFRTSCIRTDRYDG